MAGQEEKKEHWTRHPLFLLCVGAALSGLVIWVLQQRYLENQKILDKKYDLIKSVAIIPASYCQEIWNEWYAFKNSTPSTEYRANLQRIAAESNSVYVHLLIFFKDRSIATDWSEFLGVFQKAVYPIGRGPLPSEEDLNIKLNAGLDISTRVLTKMLREIPF